MDMTWRPDWLTGWLPGLRKHGWWSLQEVIGCIVAGWGVSSASPLEGSCNATEWQTVKGTGDPLDLLCIVSPQCLTGRGLELYMNFTAKENRNPQCTPCPTNLHPGTLRCPHPLDSPYTSKSCYSHVSSKILGQRWEPVPILRPYLPPPKETWCLSLEFIFLTCKK